MFVKITTSGPRQYVKLVESFRDATGTPRQRVIATLGRLESIRAGEADSLLNGLLRASGKATLEQGTGDVDFAPPRSVGDTWLLTALWQELGFADAFRRLGTVGHAAHLVGQRGKPLFHSFAVVDFPHPIHARRLVPRLTVKALAQPRRVTQHSHQRWCNAFAAVPSPIA